MLPTSSRPPHVHDALLPRRKALWGALALLMLLSCTPTRRVEPVVPITYQYAALPIYEQWAVEAQNCVLGLDALDPQDTLFVVERRLNAESFAALRWFAVPTERPDGLYACRDGQLCYGTQLGDSLYITVQGVLRSWIIKHELMHIIVKSPGEAAPRHGLPWGFCEYN